MLIAARGAISDQLAVGIFHLESFCIGIENVTFKHMEGSEFAAKIDSLALYMDVEPVEPSYARKLVRDLAAWAAEIGFAPARNYAAVEGLFGDVRADACETTFQFGREGKPFYIHGLTDSPAEARRALERVRYYIRKLDSSVTAVPVSFIADEAA